MSITKNLINYLYEEEQIDTNSIAKSIFDSLYDKEAGKFTKDPSQDIAKLCNNNQQYIHQVKTELNKLVNDFDKENKEESNLSPELKETGEKITKILKNYGVDVTLVNAKVGPRITQYEYELAPGTKINEVSNLNREISMGLAVKQVAIGPVEGETTLGIQVPNKESTNVNYQDIKGNADKSGVSMTLGKDTNGNTVSANILDLQHILIGGTTGSGKSACINTMICSLIENYSPDQVKLVLIDPKKVELSAYSDIPHLLMPIIKDPQQAVNVLDELCKVMDKRYADFEKVKVKNIDSYNKLVEKYNQSGQGTAKIMPYIVVIIDELADLMQTAGKQVESSIQRLTQLARAAGIHLIVATQRPSVDVVTGVIKSNINSRIAFTTPSQVDSRTILDQGGAEKLLGKGDMLYKPIGATNAKRVQGAFVSDDEVENIVKDVKERYGANKQPLNEPGKETSTENKENIDENYEKALEIARKARKISASLLQLELHIPYSEASRIINKMEENGIIKGQKGNGRRKVTRKAFKGEE